MERVAFVMISLLPMPPSRGGAVETIVDGLLRENEKTGRYHFTVYCLFDAVAQTMYSQYKYTKFVGLPVYPLQEMATGFFWRCVRKVTGHIRLPERAYLRRVCREMKGQSYKAVVIENQPAFVTAISKLNAGPIYMHMHNEMLSPALEQSSQISPKCHRFVGVSDFISRWLCENASARPDQCVTLLNCIETKSFRDAHLPTSSANMRRQYGLKEDTILFMFTGRINKQKGALELARAFLLMRQPDAHLMFVGSQWFGETVEDDYMREIKATLEPVRDRVHFTGFVPYAKIPVFYAMANIAVLPSQWEEPSGLTMLEAQAAGLPVITTRSGGIPENVSEEGAIILDRGEGFEERLAETMSALAADPERCAQMGKAALAWMDKRDLAFFFNRFSAIIEAD